MGDLINRQEALNAVRSAFAKSRARDRAEDCIKSIPSAIVYCKYCKYRKSVDFGMGDCLHPSGCRRIAFDNHFCALGERRESRKV